MGSLCGESWPFRPLPNPLLDLLTPSHEISDLSERPAQSGISRSRFLISGATFWFSLLAVLALYLVSFTCVGAEKFSKPLVQVQPDTTPESFPHRIWAACDFEGQTRDYAWFGVPETNNIPPYPGNRTALAANVRPYGNNSAIMCGINPVPGPRMGKENGLFLRYFLLGGDQGTFQYFSLSSEDNWHINVSGLTTGKWSSATLNFTRDARRNNGSSKPFGDGERMDDFKMMAGRPKDAKKYQLLIDDVIFFANDPELPPEPEPFPNRVIFLAAFDTGPKEKYWPGEFKLAERPPRGAHWRAAESIARKDGEGRTISLEIAPKRPAGNHTKLRFRYWLQGASRMTAQVFGGPLRISRHIDLAGLTEEEWTTAYLDFSRDPEPDEARLNAVFPAGNFVDGICFNVQPNGKDPFRFFVDEVVLFDAAEREPSRH